MHGGAAGSGGQMGERNGAYRTGAFTKAAIAERRQLAHVLSLARCVLNEIK